MLKPFLLAAAATLLGTLPVATASAEGFDDGQKAAIEQIVRDYILAHPEVVQEALVKMEEKRKADEEAARKAAVSQIGDQLYNSKYQVVLGNPDAKIALVEFFDYNCGYCKRALDDTLALLQDSDVKIVLKEFPILGPGSVEAARVAIMVNEVAPDRYLDFHKALLTGKGQADERRALSVAEELGLDVAAIKAGLKGDVVNQTLDEVYAMANKLGLSGTPTYVLADEVVFGAVGFDELKVKIDAVRACGQVSC